MWEANTHRAGKFWSALILIVGLAIVVRAGTAWLSTASVDDDLDVVSDKLLPPATPRLLAIRKSGNAIRELHERMGQQKVWWFCRVDPAMRYVRLAEFAALHGLEREGEFWRSALKRVQSETVK